MNNETKKPSNPKAFPNTDPNYFGADDSHGIDLRDYFAAKVIQGFIASGTYERGNSFTNVETNNRQLSEAAYKIADAMLKQREI